MIINRLSFILTIIATLLVAVCPARPNLYDTIANRIVVDLKSEIYNVPKLDSEVTKFTVSLQKEGLWTDINYADTAMAGWSAVQHLMRVQAFALVFGHKESRYYKKRYVYECIVNTLRAWEKAAPVLANWVVQSDTLSATAWAGHVVNGPYHTTARNAYGFAVGQHGARQYVYAKGGQQA